MEKIPEKETELLIGTFTNDQIEKADTFLKKSQE